MAVLLQDDAGSGAPQFIVTEQGCSISHYPGAVSPDSSARVCLVSLWQIGDGTVASWENHYLRSHFPLQHLAAYYIWVFTGSPFRVRHNISI